MRVMGQTLVELALALIRRRRRLMEMGLKSIILGMIHPLLRRLAVTQITSALIL